MAADILVDPIGLIGLILLISGGFIGSFTLVWRVSKNYNEQKIQIAAQDKEIAALRALVVSNQRDSENSLDKLRIERREEISKSLENQHERFNIVQKQIDSIKVDVKDVGARVNIVNTKVEGHEEELRGVNERIDKNLGFLTDWIQRVENRIEEARKCWESNLSDAKRELMGMMNMLINLSNGAGVGKQGC